jgi:hypothetical protein
VSVIYLVLQVLIIIDFGYYWSEKWANSESSRMISLLFLSSGLLWLISLTLFGLSYYWFASGASCTLEIVLLTLSVVLCVVFTVISVLDFCEHGCN